MTQEKVPRVRNEWVQLSAKWAGSGKISGCGDRTIYCSTLSDDNNDKTRAASKYLKVLLRSNNYNRSKVYYQKWNYWEFEFSPNKNKQIRTQNLEGTGKEVWKERWKTVLDTKRILLIEGIVQELGGKNIILLKWSIFYRIVRIRKLEGIDQKAWLEWGITPPNRTAILNEGTIKTLGWTKYIILINGSIFYRADIWEFYGLYSAKDDFLRCDQQDMRTEVKSNLSNSTTTYTEDNLRQLFSKITDTEEMIMMSVSSESMPLSDVVRLQLMQLTMIISTKCNRFRSLREEAYRLAARATPPIVVKGRQIRDDL